MNINSILESFIYYQEKNEELEKKGLKKLIEYEEQN